MSENVERVQIGNRAIPVHRFNTVVVGSGAAGLNAAEYLHKHGQKSVALVTEGLRWGTSLNTGSDKQTYYKLTLGGDSDDSVRKAAMTLFNGGSMDGDIALAEAACSAQCFYRLVDMGVPFPCNAYGEYVGYKTDHDPVKRGTSAGPLTSKFMTQCLLRAVEERGIPVFDKHQVIEILVGGEGLTRRTFGVLALNNHDQTVMEGRYVVFAATNVIYATGGEAGMYEQSVYPRSQTGSTGIAFRAGVKGKNLTESQYGIASVKFRWNLSGTFQQVLPRYISTAPDGGDEREFLNDHFATDEKLLEAIFLKGYQWPFDPRKIVDYGSSLVDILVFHEIAFKGRRVFLDYAQNPSRAETGGRMDFSKLTPVVHEYLSNSGALLEKPIERLAHMNQPAIDLYKSNGIDLHTEFLEIAVSAQHNNGGLAANHWWESEVRHFFPVGEVNGSHGVFRPGGSALNSGQVGGMRAARYIIQKYGEEPPSAGDIAARCGEQVWDTIAFGDQALANADGAGDWKALRQALQHRMSLHGAHIRSAEGAAKALEEAREALALLAGGLGIAKPEGLRALYQFRDLAICHFVYLFAIKNYIDQGGGSRGSYLVYDEKGEKPLAELPDVFRFRLDDGKLAVRIQEVFFDGKSCTASWRDARPVPPPDDWFETAWKRYLDGEIFN